MRPRQRRRAGLGVSTACVSNAIVLLGLTLSTCMLLRLVLRQPLRNRRHDGLTLDPPEELSDEELPDEDKEFMKLAKRLPDFKATMKEARSHKWRARSSRVQRNASTEYPSLEGLPIHVSEGNRRLRKEDIFVTKNNYDKLMAGYRDEKDMVTKSGRPTEHFKNDWLIPKRSFPDAEAEDLMGGAALRSCAVVGSSGSLLNTSFGGAIDTHDFVLRINQAPTNRKFHRHAGSHTQMRLINTRWTNKYSDFRFLEGTKDAPESSGQALPLEEGVMLVVSRAKPRHFDDMVQYLRVIREDVRVLYLSSRVVSEARRLLVSYRIRLDQAGLGPYYGGSTPSTGFLGVFMLLQLCERVTVYGFGLDSEDGRMQKYHYFELFTKSSKKNEMNPTHSFDAERDLLRAMAKFDVIKYCGFLPHNHKHNKRCGAAGGGLRRATRPSAPRSAAVTVHEVDLQQGGEEGEEEEEEEEESDEDEDAMLARMMGVHSSRHVQGSSEEEEDGGEEQGVASCCDDRHGSQEPSVPGSFVGGQQDSPRKGEKAEEAACAAEPDEPACQSEEAASDGKPATREDTDVVHSTAAVRESEAPTAAHVPKAKKGKGKGKKGRSSKAAAEAQSTCDICSKTFDSRNHLFMHIKETGHAALKR